MVPVQVCARPDADVLLKSQQIIVDLYDDTEGIEIAPRLQKVCCDLFKGCNYTGLHSLLSVVPRCN